MESGLPDYQAAIDDALQLVISRGSRFFQPYVESWITWRNLLSIRLSFCHRHETFVRRTGSRPSMGTGFVRTDSTQLTLCYAERTL